MTGYARLATDLGHSAGGLGGHELEMRRLTADHRTEADRPHRSRPWRPSLGDQRDLERARHPGHVDRVVGDAMGPQARERSLQEPAGHVLVEASRDDREMTPLAERVAPETLTRGLHPSISSVSPSISGPSTSVRRPREGRAGGRASRAWLAGSRRSGASGRSASGSRSSITRPWPSSPARFSGLFVSSRIDRTPEVVEDLGPDPVIALVRREPELQVGLHRVTPALLELVGAELVRDADRAALVAADVEDHATPLLAR